MNTMLLAPVWSPRRRLFPPISSELHSSAFLAASRRRRAFASTRRRSDAVLRRRRSSVPLFGAHGLRTRTRACARASNSIFLCRAFRFPFVFFFSTHSTLPALYYSFSASLTRPRPAEFRGFVLASLSNDNSFFNWSAIIRK